MRAAGVETIVDSASLAVVGLLEVVRHLPRIHREYRKLLAAAAERQPDLALLADSPDFHLRVARRLHARNIPVAYLVAPQVWAWRKGRIPSIRRLVRHLLCIFPFEQEFFTRHGVTATYIGHPMVGRVRPSLSQGRIFSETRFRFEPSIGSSVTWKPPRGSRPVICLRCSTPSAGLAGNMP